MTLDLAGGGLDVDRNALAVNLLPNLGDVVIEVVFEHVWSCQNKLVWAQDSDRCLVVPLNQLVSVVGWVLILGFEELVRDAL